MDMLYAFLGSLAAQLPLLIVYAVGIAMALINRRNYPRPTTFLLLAVGLSVGIQIFTTAFYILAPNYLMRGENVSAVAYGYYAYAVSLIANLGHAAAFGLLQAAIFAGRTTQSNNRAV